MTDNGLHPTSAAEWRKPREEGILVTLPYSGNTARLRPVALDSMIAQGRIPDLLTEVASSSLFKEIEVETLIDDPKLMKSFMEIFNLISLAAFMEPEVVPAGQEPLEGQITLDDVDYNDKIFVFNYATAGARALYLFRDKSKAGMAAVSNGNQNGNKTKRVSRAKK